MKNNHRDSSLNHSSSSALSRIITAAAVCALCLLPSFAIQAQDTEDQPDSNPSSQDMDVIAVPNPQADEDDLYSLLFENTSPDDRVYIDEYGGFITGTGTVDIFVLDNLDQEVQIINLDDESVSLSKEEAYAVLSKAESGLSSASSMLGENRILTGYDLWAQNRIAFEPSFPVSAHHYSVESYIVMR